MLDHQPKHRVKLGAIRGEREVFGGGPGGRGYFHRHVEHSKSLAQEKSGPYGVDLTGKA